LKRLFNILLYSCLLFVGLCLLASVGFRIWLKHEYRFPPDQRVREQFENNRADYIQFVTLLQRDQSAGFRSIDEGGRVDMNGVHSRLMPEYGHLIRKIGAKYVTVREDGSIEFSLYGFGCTICSDSYMGVRYVPKDHKTDAAAGWKHTVVTSLDSAKLPQEHGAVATGLYVVPIEPHWFIYRFEYQE
jgi:hypothetical protein